jgi:hypothetical protein
VHRVSDGFGESFFKDDPYEQPRVERVRRTKSNTRGDVWLWVLVIWFVCAGGFGVCNSDSSTGGGPADTCISVGNGYVEC